MCVALVALDATVSIEGQHGSREIPLVELHRLPGETPEIDTNVQQGELITTVTLRPNAFAGSSIYRKVRDRASYAFALISVAAALELDGDRIRNARLALGGVAHRPWRGHAAEAVLKGRRANEASFREAAEAELAAAAPLRDNGFKIDLAKRVIVDSFLKLASRETAR
jgi:xanthine dehydrogenase YagS FAD-binding subunit